MSLLLHAIGPAEAPDLGTTRGVRQQPLRRIVHGGLSAWATAFGGDRPHFGRTDLLDHHAIVEAVHAQAAACLPARFPTWLGDDEQLRGLLGHRQAWLARALERVRGRTELGITLLWQAAGTQPQVASRASDQAAEPPVMTDRAAEPPVTPDQAAEPPVSMDQATQRPVTPDRLAAGPGTAYLRQRQQALAADARRRARAEALRDHLIGLIAATGDDLVEAQHQVCPRPETALSSALLVPRAHAAGLATSLAARLGGALGAEPDVRILVLGPWPPYTFAGVAMHDEHAR